MTKPIISWSYLVGGYYDIVLGIALLFASRPLEGIIETRLEINIFNELTGLFLLAIGYLLLSYADRAREHLGIGLSSVFVRVSFVVLVVLYSIFSEIHWLFIVFAITDLLTGLLILVPTIIILRGTR